MQLFGRGRSVTVAHGAWLMAALAGGAAGGSPAQAAVPPKTVLPKTSCATLAGMPIPRAAIGLPTGGGTIVTAMLKPASNATGFPADAVPEYCEVTGYILPVDPAAPKINFQVVAPTGWNGNAFQIGGNQLDGFIPFLAALKRDNAGSPVGPTLPPDAAFPIAQGYALYGSDGGHCCASPPGPRGPRPVPGVAPMSMAWMGNDEAKRNYAYEQIKKTHDAAIAVLVQYYSRKPAKNYFSGESQGGREALMAAAHYPEDYDGATASVPLTYLTGMQLQPLYRVRAQGMPGAFIPAAKVSIVADEVRRQCDELDGLKDGVINNYMRCNALFDPDTHPDALKAIRCPDGGEGAQCLSDAQVATANAFHRTLRYGFPLGGGEDYFAGEPAGGEDSRSALSPWLIARTPPDAAALAAAEANFRTQNRAPAFALAQFNLADAKDGILASSRLVDVPPDLSRFFARGGKLIMHSSGADYVTNPRGQMQYYEAVVRKLGRAKVAASMVYYVTPQADHSTVSWSGSGVEQARQMDLLGAIERWVEQGQAPGPMIQFLKAPAPPYAMIRSRPLCQYPTYPRYLGKGDPAQAASYHCSRS